MGFTPWEGNNNGYHLCRLFHVPGIELGMSFTSFLTLITIPHNIYDPISQISQTEAQSEMICQGHVE